MPFRDVFLRSCTWDQAVLRNQWEKDRGWSPGVGGEELD